MQRAATADSLPNFSAASITERQEMVRTSAFDAFFVVLSNL